MPFRFLSHSVVFKPQPLSFRWHAEKPLPVKLIRPLAAAPRLPAVHGAPDWIASGPRNEPFDFTGHIRRLMENIVRLMPEFGHVDVSRILVGGLQARTAASHGLQARVTPLRFRRGSLTRARRNVLYQVQRYFLGEREFLYLMTFCLPRFLEQDFDGKLITLFHELYHIGTDFDGDLRRHDGRYQLHTHSQRSYDRGMAKLARDYLALKASPELHDFLRLNFSQLVARHGGVAAVIVPHPKIVPLQAAQQT